MKRAIQYAIEMRAVTYFAVFILFFGGIGSFFSLSQLEDPVFTIKTAIVSTEYPGAGPKEVELEVTDRLELAIQQMPQIKNIYSTSRAGESIIKVDIKDRYWSDKLPQIWDELRKKVRDAAGSLPPGASAPRVIDDFGDVYGFVLALTGDGFEQRELEYYADSLKKELGLIKGVSRVELWGVQPQVIYVDVSEQKLKDLGISGTTLLNALKKQNMVVDSGGLEIDRERLRIAPTGEFRDPGEIGDLTVRPSPTDTLNQFFSSFKHGLGGDRLADIILNRGEGSYDFVRLKDIARVRRGYPEPPPPKMRYNGQSAIAIQIAGQDDANIVDVGERIDNRLEELKELLPIGININKIAWQSDIVDESIRSFIVNLIEAIIIVLVVLVIPSGLRMGFIIGFDLIITILATFIFMRALDIPLQRMSLGALIIALGMMVDNAIVVSDNIAVKIGRGIDRYQAAVTSAASSSYPLLAATLVAVLAFYPIYAATTGAGEYCNTLFIVVAAALIISWLIAMLVTPLQCIDLLPVPRKNEIGEEFDTSFYRRFRLLLIRLIRLRYLSIAVLGGALLISLYFFGYVDRMFFPDSSRAQMMVDYWVPEGTNVEQVAEDIRPLEKAFLASPLTDSVSAFIGQGPPRFYLPVDPEGKKRNYAQIIVNFPTYKNIDAFIREFKPWAEKRYPYAMIRFRKYAVGPGDTWKFEARFSGPATADLGELRSLGTKVIDIVQKSPYGTSWRLDVLNRTLKWIPVYDQKRARLSAISREDLARTIKRAFDGNPVGLYREKDKLLPIIVRNSAEERREIINRFELLQIQPPHTTENVPLAQAISDLKLAWEDPIIVRWNRRRAVTVQGNPILGETFPRLIKDVIDRINAIRLPAGYELYWDGEASSTEEAQESLIPGMLPAVVVILFLIISVFNAYRPLLMILMTIPFSLIGVTWGLLILGTPFGFLALLGAMSLAGMMNKNIVVLLDACEENIAKGMERMQAIVEASVTRVRPVLLAAGTTVLGVIPLVTDVFWTAMAVTIMAGLAFGSILTLLVVPILYSILYKTSGGKKG